LCVAKIEDVSPSDDHIGRQIRLSQLFDSFLETFLTVYNEPLKDEMYQAKEG